MHNYRDGVEKAFSFPCLCSEHRFSLPPSPKIYYGEQKKPTRRNGGGHMESLIVLVHSPLVGPFTWSLVAKALQADGFDVLVPVLTDSGKMPPPYWQQHAVSVRQVLASIPPERPLVLVGHSGAGPLLPLLAQAARHPVKAYLFVDAGLPHPGKTQLEEMPEELRRLLAEGARFPNWKDEDLREVLPDGRARQQLLAEVQPRPLTFFEEVLPEVSGWPEAPGGYLLFTQGYCPYLEQAQRAGWPSRTFHAGHFHMLVDPAAVAATLVELMQQINETR
jgi:pimeloyl-ACP methyl ester carboxylesterase